MRTLVKCVKTKAENGDPPRIYCYLSFYGCQINFNNCPISYGSNYFCVNRYSSSMTITGDEGTHSDNIFRYILNITSTLFRLDKKTSTSVL